MLSTNMGINIVYVRTFAASWIVSASLSEMDSRTNSISQKRPSLSQVGWKFWKFFGCSIVTGMITSFMYAHIYP